MRVNIRPNPITKSVATDAPPKIVQIAATAAGRRRFLAFFQQFSFFVLHVVDQSANVVHRLFASVGQHHLTRRFEILGPAQIDGLRQFVQLGPHQRTDRLKRPLFNRVVGGQIPNIGKDLIDFLHGEPVRLEIAILGGNQVTSLARFGILHGRQQVGQTGQNLMGMRSPRRGFAEPPCILKGNGRHDQQDQQYPAQTGPNLCTDGKFHSQIPLAVADGHGDPLNFDIRVDDNALVRQ